MLYGTILQTDGDKLNRWAEHFQEVANCEVSIDIPSDNLPVIPLSPPSSVTPLSDDDLDAPLSEEEISAAISQLRSGKSPGLDGISLEMPRLVGK